MKKNQKKAKDTMIKGLLKEQDALIKQGYINKDEAPTIQDYNEVDYPTICKMYSCVDYKYR